MTSDNAREQAVPTEGAAYPVDSTTRSCCRGIGRHAPGCSASVPRLQDVLAEHQAGRRVVDSPEGSAWACRCGEPHSPVHVAQVWREVCTIATVEQLDALPEGVIVRDGQGDAWRKSGRFSPVEPWWVTGSEIERSAADVVLPTLLLWHPDWEATQ